MELRSIKYRFQKQEKLCSEKQIALLFEKGKRGRADNLKLRYLIRGADQFVYPRILISVPRKLIRRATARNRIKRQLREAYRLNKAILIKGLIEKPLEVDIAIIFSGKAGLSYKELEQDMKKLLNRISEDVLNIT